MLLKQAEINDLNEALYGDSWRNRIQQYGWKGFFSFLLFFFFFSFFFLFFFLFEFHRLTVVFKKLYHQLLENFSDLGIAEFSYVWPFVQF